MIPHRSAPSCSVAQRPSPSFLSVRCRVTGAPRLELPRFSKACPVARSHSRHGADAPRAAIHAEVMREVSSEGAGRRGLGRASARLRLGWDDEVTVDGALPVRLRRAGERSPEEASAALRTWRSETAKRDKVPAYVVFSDAHLEGIAAALPSNLKELSRCKGIGPAKLEKYGDEILAILDSLESGASVAAARESSLRERWTPGGVDRCTARVESSWSDGVRQRGEEDSRC